MQLGSFEVPEVRLVPNSVADVRIIYDSVQNEQSKTKDLATYLGYSHATASRFYLRLNAMVSYGLLDGRGTYNVSELGKNIAYPESDKHEQEMRTKAVFNVSLWKEIYNKFKKSPPKENFWVHLKNITGIEPKKAQDVQSLIFKWYSEDIAHVSEDHLLDQDNEEEHLRSSSPNRNMSQQIVIPKILSLGQLIVPTMGTIEINDEDTLTIARSYLTVLEKKIKEKKTESISSQEATDFFNQENN